MTGLDASGIKFEYGTHGKLRTELDRGDTEIVFLMVLLFLTGVDRV